VCGRYTVTTDAGAAIVDRCDGGERFAFAGLCDGRRAAIVTTAANRCAL
jgi:hypothetical protein